MKFKFALPIVFILLQNPVFSQSIPTSASFIKSDGATLGNWSGVYGKDGALIYNDVLAQPPFANVTLSGDSQWVWASTTSDPRALTRAQGNNRTAACWFQSTFFEFIVNITDNQEHQLSMYMIDWDNLARAQTVAVRDTVSGTVLDTQNVTGFVNGRWLIWKIRGRVTFRITRTGGANAVVSGVFFDTDIVSSPDGTRIPPSTLIVDKEGASWMLRPQQQGEPAPLILRNGVSPTQPAYNSYGFAIKFIGSVIYNRGDDVTENWYKWIGPPAYWQWVGTVEPGSPVNPCDANPAVLGEIVWPSVTGALTSLSFSLKLNGVPQPWIGAVLTENNLVVTDSRNCKIIAIKPGNPSSPVAQATYPATSDPPDAQLRFRVYVDGVQVVNKPRDEVLVGTSLRVPFPMPPSKQGTYVIRLAAYYLCSKCSPQESFESSVVTGFEVP